MTSWRVSPQAQSQALIREPKQTLPFIIKLFQAPVIEGRWLTHIHREISVGELIHWKWVTDRRQNELIFYVRSWVFQSLRYQLWHLANLDDIVQYCVFSHVVTVASASAATPCRQISFPIKARKGKMQEEDKCKLPNPSLTHLSGSLLITVSTHITVSLLHAKLDLPPFHLVTSLYTQSVLGFHPSVAQPHGSSFKLRRPSWSPLYFLLLNKISSWACPVPSLSPIAPLALKASPIRFFLYLRKLLFSRSPLACTLPNPECLFYFPTGYGLSEVLSEFRHI